MQARFVLATSMSLLCAGTAWAGCSNGLPLKSGFPTLPGFVVFQATDTQGAQHLFLFNFANHTQTKISANWGLLNPRNPHVSYDGKFVVFTAVDHNNTRTDAYLWTVGAASPVGLTTGLQNQRYEDVNFTATDYSVTLKVALTSLYRYTLNLAQPSNPVITAQVRYPISDTGQTNTEKAGPFLSSDGFYLLFWRHGTQPDSVRVFNTRTNVETTLAPTSVAASYFPVIQNVSTYFYAGQTTVGGNDLVYFQSTNVTSGPVQIAAQDCNANNSDPAPVNTDYLLYSNTSQGHGYKPYLATIKGASVYDASTIGLGVNVTGVLGMSYNQNAPTGF